jgi:ADP-ribose pyrophosphatase YjhB (NUDIX family)
MLTKTSNKRKIANWVQKIPFLWAIALRVYRVFLPWRTVGAVGVVINPDGKVLIVEHVLHPQFPWGLPGGWMDNREDPGDTVRREVFEETGLNVRVVRPLLVEHTPYLPRHLDVSYLCLLEDSNAEIKLSSELIDYRWVEFTELEKMLRFHQRTAIAAREAWLSLSR